MMENALKMGRRAMKRLKEMEREYEIVGDVRGKGLFIGVEIVKSKKRKERGDEESAAIVKSCLKSGLILITAGRNTLRVIPPLNITAEELDEGLDILNVAVKSVSHSGS